MFKPGRYYGTLKAWATTKAKSNNSQAMLTFEITHELDGDTWASVGATDRTMYLSLTDGAWPYTQQKLEALGFNGDFGDGMDFGDDAKHEGVELKCEHQDYEGKTRERWDLASWGSGGGGEPLDDETEIRRLNTLWKAKAGKPKPPPPAKPKPAAPVAAGVAAEGISDEIANDDIPF